jgi:cell division protein FtsN
MKTQVKQLNPILRKQAGGTFLGLILGLIVGLGIAVVVALVITKSPIPFVNKVAKQERTELSPGQASDPNKPLYGKDTVRETPTDTRADQAPARPAADIPKADLTPPAPAPKSTDSTKVTTPAKDQPVKSDSASSTGSTSTTANATASGTDDKWTYFLQTGAFREQADAESARAKLALLGFEAKVSDRPSDNGTLYRVRIGPISQSETVNRMRTKLSDNGIDAAIVRTPK